jgi:hypothetical protein
MTRPRSPDTEVRRLRQVLWSVLAQCDDGITVCPHCGHEDTMRDLDIADEIRRALAPRRPRKRRM